MRLAFACLAVATAAVALACRPAAPAPAASPAAAAPALPSGHPPTGDIAGAPLPPGHAPVAGSSAAGPAAAPIAGSVQLGAAVTARAATARALYVIARKAGTRDVVAVKRLDASRFPVAFELSDGDVMMQGTAFQGPFDVTARLSQSGDAIPAPGDLEGVAPGVAGGATGVTITLDTVRQ